MLYLCEKNNIMGKGDRKTRKGKRFVGSSRKRTKLNCYGINKKEQKKIIDYQQEAAYAILFHMVIYLILKVLLMKNNIKFYIFFVERT